MPFSFKNFDEYTRTLMLAEVDHDVDESTLFLSERLTPKGQSEWPTRLRAAIEQGDESTLCNDLGAPGGLFLNAQEPDQKNGCLKAVPRNAGQTLAEGEFNRFYIRGLCQRAIESGGELVIYRARASKDPDAASEARIGDTRNPLDLLNDLRKRTGVATALGLPPHPNSGLSVKLVDVP
jgi:hypothetical protein